MSNQKTVAIYYHAPPGANTNDTHIANEINGIKDLCRQNDWKPEHTFVDKTESGSMYKTFTDYISDTGNSVSAYLCFTAKSSFSGLVGKGRITESVKDADDSDIKNFTGGGVPFGYMVGRDGALVLEDDRAAVIQEIFKNKSEGASLQRIADMLNAKNIKSSRGGVWSKQGIAFILKNPAYVGEYQYNGIVRNIPEIISKQLFKKANGSI